METKSRLNTQNPEHLVFKYHELAFIVLGGVRTEGLDRMRVTLKIELKNTAIRHNLDLYNDTQADKLVRKTAEKLGIGSAFAGKALGELTGELENYRLQEIEKQSLKPQVRKVLSPEERAQAETFLKAPELLERTGEHIGLSGIVGEELNRLIMLLIYTSRKTSRPLHIVSFGSSGTGKSHLQEKVSELIPSEDKIEITSLTGNAFYYFDKDELGHKLILIEDLDGVLAALYPIRELQSKQKISKTVTIKDKKGNAKTIHLVVHGPVCIAGCTTKESLYEDNANRSFLLYLDESEEQDEKVMQYQRLMSAGKVNQREENRIKALLQNVQRVLQPLSVRNPYAEYLKIPREVLKVRRTNAHYMAFIEAITFYKQYQREQKTDPDSGELYIETTLEDIAEANRLMKPVLLRKSDELSGACRSYFESLKKYIRTREGESTGFSNKEIRAVLRIAHSRQKKHMVELQQYGHIRKKEGDKKKGYLYEIPHPEEYEVLQRKVNSVLDEILQSLKAKEVQQFKEVPAYKEPLKTLSVKGKQVKIKEVPATVKTTPKKKAKHETPAPEQPIVQVPGTKL